ncbi:damage-inducible protein DinB [Gracilibacillus oryzae]|uniref:Damage-inducible protein DinB n=1 Tax=Gracilibacillus oryzae TaxID=1672701 RepID=A0A7C8GUB2_9BACI|nr:DinB family protein [Gracilibacillus oryzae]KAB8137511.1 damage-inducible protein DinB [Gracilibacillus oryzae]
MYRKVSDFIYDWDSSAEGTIKVLESITDDKLGQAIVPGHSTLGWLGWHLATAPGFFAGMVGLDVKSSDPEHIPQTASVIVEAYKNIAEDIRAKAGKLTDEDLSEEVDSFGAKIPRGSLLRTLIDHQTHHRGQMTVLLRQAGLPVPGIMGPTKEESQQ